MQISSPCHPIKSKTLIFPASRISCMYLLHSSRLVHWTAWARLFPLVSVEKHSNGRCCFSASLIEFISSNEITSNQSQPTRFIALFQFTCMVSKMSFFFYLHSTDASSATDMNCEIKSSCSSSVCEKTNPMTVLPGSNVTLNCLIVAEGLAQGMTWNQTSERVKNTTGLPNLVLERTNLTTNSGKHSCQCTTIHFTRTCFLIVHQWYQK